MALTQLFEQDNDNHAMDCPALLTLIGGAHTSQGRREIFWVAATQVQVALANSGGVASDRRYIFDSLSRMFYKGYDSNWHTTGICEKFCERM